MMYRVLIAETDIADTASLRRVLKATPAGALLQIETIQQMSELDKTSSDNRHIDIALVNIDFEDREDGGILLAKKLLASNRDTQVIFMSDDDRLRESVYEVEHLSFCYKDDVLSNIEHYVERAFANLRENSRKRLIVKIGYNTKVIPSQSIEYIESRRRKVLICLADERVEAYGSLSEIKFRLPDFFVRCHKSYLVNMGCIAELRTTEMVLKSGKRIPVSQSRKDETRQCVLHYYQAF